jgi:hypothetical protein
MLGIETAVAAPAAAPTPTLRNFLRLAVLALVSLFVIGFLPPRLMELSAGLMHRTLRTIVLRNRTVPPSIILIWMNRILELLPARSLITRPAQHQRCPGELKLQHFRDRRN